MFLSIVFFFSFFFLKNIFSNKIYDPCFDFDTKTSSFPSPASLAIIKSCFFNSSLNISQSLKINSSNLISSIFLSDNSSFLINNSSNLTISNIVFDNENKGLISNYFFLMENNSMIFLHNVSFVNNLNFSIIFSKNSHVFIEFCFFSNILNTDRNFIEANENSSVILIRAKFNNFTFFSSRLISLKNSSILNISELEIKNCLFNEKSNDGKIAKAIIENDYNSYFDLINLDNNNISGSFIRIEQNPFNLNIVDLKIEILNSYFSSVSNLNTNDSLFFRILGKNNASSLLLQNLTFYQNKAKFSFFSFSLSKIFIKNTYFTQNLVNFALFYALNSYSFIMTNVTFQQQNYQNKEANSNFSWSGSCIILENVLIKKFFNISITNSFSIDSTIGIQFYDYSSILKTISEKNKHNKNEEIGFISIISSFFENNYVFYTKNLNISGVLYIDSDSQIIISDSYFRSNKIDSIAAPEKKIGGPCLNSFTFKIFLTIQKSIFVNNSAKFFSNCIYFSGAQLIIEKSLFDSNIPLFGLEILNFYETYKKIFVRVLEALPSGFAGSLKFQGEILSIYDSYFLKNEGYIGGGILIDGSLFHQNLKLTINNTIFDQNSAGTMGGAIYFTKDIKHLDGIINNSYFLRNDARYGGGISTEFNNEKDYLSIHNIIFYANQAQYCGGLLIHQRKGLVNFTNSKFYNNHGFLPVGMTLPILGGAFGLWGDSETLGISMNNYFLNNIADSNGGVIGMVGSNLKSYNDIFEKNIAIRRGSLFSISNSIVNISNATIFDNIAGISTSIATENSLIFFDHILFLNNTALVKSGLLELYIHTSIIASFLIVNSSFAPINGIINLYENYEAKIEFSNCTFFLNHADSFLIDLLNSNIAFKFCYFYNNTSSFFGLDRSTLNISDSIITNHSCILSDSSKGCFINSETDSKIVIRNTEIINIKSLDKSTLFYSSFSIIIISECLIDQIHSSIFKQSIYIEFSEIKINSTNFIDTFPSVLNAINSTVDMTYSKISINYTDFLSNSLILIKNSNYIKIISCIFSGNKAGVNGSVFFVLNSEDSFYSNISIENSIFNDSFSSMYGGAIYIYNVKVLIKNCSFFNNIAKKGGAIFYESSLENSSLMLTIKDKCFFSFNKALEGGGAIMWVNTVVLLESGNVLFKSNEAIYGKDIASPPMRIFVEISSKQEENKTIIEKFNSEINSSDYIIQNQIPGQFLNMDLILRYVDYYNQTVETLDEILENVDIATEFEKNNIVNINSFFLFGNSTQTYLIGDSFLIKKGKLNISHAKIFTPPSPKTLYIVIKSSYIQNLAVYISNFHVTYEKKINQNYVIIVPINISSCQIGQTTHLSSCFTCQNNKFSINPTEISCQTCPLHASCPGGSDLDLNPGYWRFLNSTNIYYCDISENNCNGGITSSCANNYIGPLCRSCPRGYYDVQKTMCLSCGSYLWNIFRMFVVIVGLVIILLVLVKSALDNITLYDKLILQYKEERVNDETLRKVLDFQSIYMKIFVNYLQIHSFLDYIPFSWPSFLEMYFQIFSSVASISTKFLAFECLFKESDIFDFRLFKFICINLLPFVLVILACVGFKLYYLIRKYRLLNLNEKVFSTIFGVYLMILPNIVQESIRSLSCIKIDQLDYLMWEPAHLCDQSYNKMTSFIVWPLFLLWSIIFPGAIFIYLAIRRKKLYTKEYFKKFNFIYFGYKSKYFYWDMVILIKKFLASILVLAPLNSTAISLMLSIIIVIYTVIFVKCKPFLNRILNTLEYLSCMFLLMGIFIFGFIIQFDKNSSTLSTIMKIALFLNNICFLMIWSWSFLVYVVLKYSIIIKRRFPYVYSKILIIYNFIGKKFLKFLTQHSFVSRLISPKLNSPKSKKFVLKPLSAIRS